MEKVSEGSQCTETAGDEIAGDKMMLKFIFLAMYLIASGIHVYGSFVYNNRIRQITKPMLMSALLLFYIAAAESVNPLVAAAVITSWAGDVFLMFKGMKWLNTGGVAFFLTHVALITLYVQNIHLGWQSAVVIITYFIIGSGIITSMYLRLKRYMPKSNLAMLLAYLCVNILMNLFAALQATSGAIGGTLILLGSTLFLASDSLLYMIRFDKKMPFYGKHANVMLTYTMAKLLIVLGFLA